MVLKSRTGMRHGLPCQWVALPNPVDCAMAVRDGQADIRLQSLTQTFCGSVKKYMLL